jgi:hypothetical protein
MPVAQLHDAERHPSIIDAKQRHRGERVVEGTPMTWSIRNQILIPLIGIQVIAVTAVALATAALAVRRGELEIVARLNGVLETLEHGNFPLTATVLAKMSGLSGAHFVVVANDGQIKESSLAMADPFPSALRSIHPTEGIDTLDHAPAITMGGTRYFALPVQPIGRPRDVTLWVLYPETSLSRVRWEAALPPSILGLASLAAMILVTSWIAHRMSARIKERETSTRWTLLRMLTKWATSRARSIAWPASSGKCVRRLSSQNARACSLSSPPA